MQLGDTVEADTVDGDTEDSHSLGQRMSQLSTQVGRLSTQVSSGESSEVELTEHSGESTEH